MCFFFGGGGIFGGNYPRGINLCEGVAIVQGG